MHPNCRFVFSINAISKADSVIVTRDIHRSFSFTFNLNDYLYGFSSKNDIKAHTCRCAQLRLNNPFTEKKVVDVISATLNRVADIIRSIKAVFAYVLKIAKWIEKNVYLRHKEAAYGCDSYIHMFFFLFLSFGALSNIIKRLLVRQYCISGDLILCGRIAA